MEDTVINNKRNMSQEGIIGFGGCISVLITMCNIIVSSSPFKIGINSNIFMGQKFKFFDF